MMISRILPVITLIGFLCGCSDTTAVTPPARDEERPVPVLKSFGSSYDNKAVYDQKLILNGSNFSPDTKGNIVKFGNIACSDIIDASETEIVVKVPRIEWKKKVLLTVTTEDGTSNGLSLEFDKRRCDSVIVFTGAKVEELRQGVKWTSTLTEWEGKPRSINIVTIPKSEIKNLHFTYPSGKKKTSVQCIAADALVGINGQYFDMSGTGLARDYLKIDGVIKTNGANNRSETFAGGAFVFNDNGADIVKVNRNEGARRLLDENVMTCGPLLINDGTYCSLDLNSTHNTNEHPRTAVGITEEGNVLFVTVDGRFSQAVGMSTSLMQEIFTILGAKSALNLDGGGSTTMYIKGKGIVNHPCDNTNWYNPNEREVNSIIYLK